MIRTTYAGDSHYGANEEASPCAPGELRAGSGWVAPLTDRNLATAPVGQLGGWKNVNVRLPCGLALGCGA